MRCLMPCVAPECSSGAAERHCSFDSSAVREQTVLRCATHHVLVEHAHHFMPSPLRRELWYVEERDLLALALRGSFIQHPVPLVCPKFQS